METIKLKVNGVKINKDGQLVIVTPPSKHNQKGAFVMSEAQAESILRNAGIPSIDSLKHFNDLTNGTSKLVFDATLCKAGDTYTKKDGSTGVYGDKDWTKLNNFRIELGFAATAKLAELSYQFGMLNKQVSRQVAPKVELEIASDETASENTEAPQM